MNKNKKDFMDQLSNLDDYSVEEIAENYPALFENTKKRVLKKCLKKDVFSAEINCDGEEAITISGTERYNRSIWYKVVASAAAFAIAAVGITSAVMLNRNANRNDFIESENNPALSIHNSWTDSESDKSKVTTSDSGYIGSWDSTKPEDSAVPANNPISLSGTYWIDLNDDGPVTKALEFAEDGVSGDYIIMPENILTTDATKTPFTYEQNGYDIVFSIGPDDTVMAKMSAADWRVIMTIEWQDGHTECFYNTGIMTNSSGNGDGSLGYWGTNENETSQAPTTAIEPTVNNTVSFNSVSLNETRWDEEEIEGSWKHAIEFSNDGFSGHYVIPSENLVTTNSTLIYFTYTQNGNDITFYKGSDIITGKLSSSNNDPRGEVMLTLIWADGHTEYFYTRNITINSDGSLKYWLPPDDGYSAKPPIADTTLNGTRWDENELDGPVENFIVFGNDGFSGHYGTTPESYETADAELIYLTYTKNENDIILYIGSDIVTGKLSSSNNDPRGEVMLTLVWADGHTEYLYSYDFPFTALQN